MDERLFLPFIGLAFQSFAPFLRFVCVKRLLLILLFCSSLSVLVSSESESLRAETERRERESRLREARGERREIESLLFSVLGLELRIIGEKKARAERGAA